MQVVANLFFTFYSIKMNFEECYTLYSKTNIKLLKLTENILIFS